MQSEQASNPAKSPSSRTDRISTPGDLTPDEVLFWRDGIIQGIKTVAGEALGHYARSTDDAVRTAACSELLRRQTTSNTEAKLVTNPPPADLWPPVYLEFSMSKNAYLLRLPGNVTRSVELPGDLNSQLNALRLAAIAASKV